MRISPKRAIICAAVAGSLVPFLINPPEKPAPAHRLPRMTVGPAVGAKTTPVARRPRGPWRDAAIRSMAVSEP